MSYPNYEGQFGNYMGDNPYGQTNPSGFGTPNVNPYGQPGAQNQAFGAMNFAGAMGRGSDFPPYNPNNEELDSSDYSYKDKGGLYADSR